MQERLTNLLEFLKESPGDPFLLFAIAQEYSQKKDYQPAKEYFLRLKQSHPRYIGLYYHLGKLEQLLGNNQEAMNVFETGMTVAKSIGDMHAWSELKAAFEDAREF